MLFGSRKTRLMKSLSDRTNAVPRTLVALLRRAEFAVFSKFASAVSAADPHHVVKNYLFEKPEFEEAFEAYEKQGHSHAFELFKNFADQGDSAAQNIIGVLYETGAGVNLDDGLAEEWYRKAALQGMPDAQFNLAAILVSDLMVGEADYVAEKEADYDAEKEERLLTEAYMWVTLAAAQDHPEASTGGIRLRKHMTEAHVAESQRLAREWKPKKEGQ